MLQHRIFNLVITLLLIIVVVFTVREAAATAGVIREGDSTKGEILKCMSLPSRYSLRTEYVKEAKMWVIQTEDGPTGVDGGFIHLLSDYRTCSR
jgi:hypothetical protein